MVHALEMVHSLLKPEGRLIDIHPSGEPPAFIVRSGAHDEIAGWLQEKDDFIEYQQAEAALAQAVKERWFTREQQREFIFNNYAETIAELAAYLTANWSDAIILPETVAQADALQRAAQGKSKVLLRENARISRFRPEHR